MTATAIKGQAGAWVVRLSAAVSASAATDADRDAPVVADDESVPEGEDGAQPPDHGSVLAAVGAVWVSTAGPCPGARRRISATSARA